MNRPLRRTQRPVALAALALLLAPAAACTAEESSSASTAGSGSSASEASASDEKGSSALQEIDRFIEQQKIETGASGWKTKLPKPPKASFDDGKRYFWNLDTSEGSLKVRLMPEVAPMHVSSTIYLTRLGFYDDTVFHRVIPDFMAQGGDPLGRGTGGPGYQYEGEFDPKVRHDRKGLLSMANAGPGTDGSQFFLTFVPTPWLDGKHTIFGEVVEGQEVLDKLEAKGTRQGRPQGEPPKIRTATISVE